VLPQVAEYWESVLRINEWQKSRFAAGIVSAMFNTVSGKRLAIFGVAYTKNTDDTRFTPAWDVCSALLKERAQLAIYDPKVSREAINLALIDDSSVERLVHVRPPHPWAPPLPRPSAPPASLGALRVHTLAP
jgi:UDPglucose 6-dehydrogenase